MKKYIFINKIFLFLFMIMMSSCEGIFILDPIDPRLPKYTEKGNDVAGALVNDKVWKSIVEYGFLTSSDKPHIIASQSNDSLVIRFEGDVLGSVTTMEFHLTGLHIKAFADLILLKDKKVQLDGTRNAGFMRDNSDISYSTKGGAGQIYFRHVEVNNVSGVAILSGTFGFSFVDNFSAINEVAYGRFDYKFGKNDEFLVEYD